MAAHVQLHAKRESVQMLKERINAWCAMENLRERQGMVRDSEGVVQKVAGEGNDDDL